MAMSVGELLALIRVDDSGFDRGVDRAERRLRGFQRDANGRLHDVHGRFVREGDEAGKGLAAGIGKGAEASIGKLLGIGKALGKWAAVGVIGALAANSAVNVLALVASLSSLLGLAVAVPAAMVAGAGALAAFKIGLSGVADAIGGDEEALAKLAPQARAVVGEIRGLDGAWQRVRQTVQGAMFAPLRGEVTALAKTWLPVLRTQLGGIAAEFGLMGRSAATAARDPGFVASIGSALTWLRQMLAANRGAVGDLVTAFGTIVGAITPVLGISGGLGEMAERFRVWTAEAAKSGQLAGMWQTALSVLQQLGGIVSNLGGIFGAVFGAAKASGGDVLGVLFLLLEQVNQFLNSGAGQSALVAIFQGLGQVVTALKPAFQAVLPALGTALATLAPALGPLAGVISQVLIALAPLLPVVGQLAAMLAGVLGMALQNLLAILAPIITALVGSLQPVIPILTAAFQQWMGAMAPLAASLGQLLGQALAQILPVILQLVPTLLTGLLPAFTAILGAVLQLLPALMPMIPAWMQLLLALMPIIPLVGQLAAQIIGALVPVLLPLINLVVRLAVFLIGNLAKSLTWVINNGIRPLINILGDFIGWLGKVLTKVTTFVADMLGKLGELPGKIKGFFSDAGNWLLDAGGKIIDGLIGGIKSGFQRVKDTLGGLTSLLPDWKGPARRDRTLLAPAGRMIMGGLMSGMRGEFPSIRSMLGRLTGEIAGTAGRWSPALAFAGAPAAGSTTNTRTVSYTTNIYPQRAEFDAEDLRHEQHKQALRERADREW
ncbi:hypothetical protein AB0N38_33080 [Micromonospora aurantiaca]|uniref:phage tail protein n=1 Tax=Micromonospora aurantiaca (nom. illeg.) TaxID=47850 RepID=UPI003419DAFE